MARIRKMRVSFEIVKHVFGQGGHTQAFTVIESGLPADARLVAVTMSPTPLVSFLDMHIESEMFTAGDDEFITPVLQAD